MVTRRIRTEYMKRFKDPKWETYSRCYEELHNYRLSRRMLEHSHKPWFWSGSDTDSDASPTPHHPRNQVDPLREDGGTGGIPRQQEEYNQCGGGGDGGPAGGTSTVEPLVPKICLPDDEEEEDDGVQGAAAGGVRAEENTEQRTISRASKHPDKPVGSHAQQTKQGSSKTRKSCVRGSSRVRPSSPPRKASEDAKENRHPFALYGSGEQQAEMAGRKTHNVGPAASTQEIHESALRAKSRREAERQIQAQRAERRKTKSADLAKNKSRLSQPEFNPWLTEYMRCFSSCSR